MLYTKFDCNSFFKAKYPKAVECLEKDKEKLLTFYDFPAENWQHIRITNPIESTFATVRHRTYKAKSCFSQTTIVIRRLIMLYTKFDCNSFKKA